MVDKQTTQNTNDWAVGTPLKTWMDSVTLEGSVTPATLVTPAVFTLIEIRWLVMNEETTGL